MLPAPAQLYACPHCRNKKPMLSRMSGNTFGGEIWSDGRAIYPMLPKISIIQKCPNCGKYSLFQQWKNTGRTDSDASGTAGDLSYSEAKEAYKELFCSSLNKQNGYEIALFFVHAYNDEFRRPRIQVAIYEDKLPSNVSGCFASPTDEDITLFFEASQFVIDNSNRTQDDLILKAELHRERGEWVEAYDILHGMSAGDNQWIVDAILYHACKRDASLLPLIIRGKRKDYSNLANFSTLSIPEDPEILCERKNNLNKYFNDTLPEIKKGLYTDILGGVYDKSSNTLIKLVTPSPQKYEVEDETRNIGDFAVFRNEQLYRLHLPSCLKTIGIKAFYGCKNLSEVFMQGSYIEVIGDCAFRNCKSLSAIHFIDNVKFLGRSVFAGMDKLQSIGLPNGIEIIPEFTFFECESLNSIFIPTSVRHIASYSFQHTAINELELPDSVLTLGDAVFSRCLSLEKVKLSSMLVVIPERTFDSCKILREISIPKNVKRIDKEAFADMSSLERVEFHGKVDAISETAFRGSALSEIIVPFWAKAHYSKLFPNVRITTKIL